MSEDQPLLIAETRQPYNVDPEHDRIRIEYKQRLAEKLSDPEFRRIEGFPIGTNEAILALSDPPYHTACPNPFIKEWLREHGKPFDPNTDIYHREPFAADVSEGKTHPIYNAHAYHTKVPHRAIMRYILHYTEPGDIVYDGFCGTGMTGVAAQLCGDVSEVRSLGLTIQGNAIESEPGDQLSRIGCRRAIVSDLSPVATFISSNYNRIPTVEDYEPAAQKLLNEIDTAYGWMYLTLHNASHEDSESLAKELAQKRNLSEIQSFFLSLTSDPTRKIKLGKTQYTLWSDIVGCPACSS